MKRYILEHSEDRLYTSLHDRKLDLTYTVTNLDSSTDLVPVYLRQWWDATYSTFYHVRNILRIAWFQKRKKLV